MDISSIIADISQSVITKGVNYIEITIDEADKVNLSIKCMDFSFPADCYNLRSMGYEYIFKNEYSLSGDTVRCKLDLPLGNLKRCVSSVISCNPHIAQFDITYKNKNGKFNFSLMSAREELGYVFMGEANVIDWMEERINAELLILSL